ncbi:hypothetical protein E4U21_004798 [Claviceps maximensis]|nr:hypothetical protein E4U21_004798 [Claviceps maximensis]
MSAKIILPLLSASSLYSIWYYVYANDLGDVVEPAILEIPVLPLISRKRISTAGGASPLDGPEGSLSGAFLQGFALAGTMLAGFLMITMESWREGSRGTVAANPMVLNFLAQLLTLAFGAPLYAYIHITRSATASKPTPVNMRIPHNVVRAIPWVFTLVSVMPSLVLTRPLFENISQDAKYTLMAIFQFWPAYLSALLLAARHVMGASSGVDNDMPAENKHVRRALGFAYAYAFANAAIPHLVTVTISVATAVVPHMFSVRVRRGARTAENVWPALEASITTTGQGMEVILWWDNAISAAGVEVNLRNMMTKVVLLSVVASPAAATVELMWEREEMFLGHDDDKSSADWSKDVK